MAFTKYNPPKYSKYITRKNTLNELCSCCGYRYGEHYGTTCPKKGHVDHPPEFFIKKINSHIHIL
jgi:hypothetical protein